MPDREDLSHSDPTNGPFDRAVSLYRQSVNPVWLDVLSEIGILRQFVAGDGAYVIDEHENRFLDLVAGFGAAALGHGHPQLIAALAKAIQNTAPGIVPWGISSETGYLAAKLCGLAGSQLTKTYFASGGAEAIDAALKFAAAATGRNRFLVFDGGFHGLTAACTGLSGGIWSEPFPQIWPTFTRIPAQNAGLLKAAIANGPPAAVILEIVQGTGGTPPWDATSLAELAHTARASGTLIIVDEVMTGLGRTGDWFAFSTGGGDFLPDMVVVSKTLTGGLIPMSAVLMREEIFQKVFTDRVRAKIHGSTLSGGRVAMACGLAVLEVIDQSDLIANVRARSEQIAEGVRILNSRGLGAGIVGRGLLLGINASTGDQAARAETASATCLGLLDRGVLTSIAAHDPGLVRLTPPFVLTEDDVSLFLDALEDTFCELSSTS